MTRSLTRNPSAAPMLLALGIVYVVWGSTYLAIRIAVGGMPPFMMAGLRFLCASLLLIGAGVATRQPWPSWRQIRGAALVGLFLLLGGNGLVVWSEQFVPSGMAALLVSSLPLWILAFESLIPHGDRPTPLGVAGVLLGFAGVVTLLFPKLSGGETHGLWAQGAVVVGTMLWAIGTMIGRRVSVPRSGIYNSAFSMLAASIGFLAVSAAFGEPARTHWQSISPGAWWSFAYLVVFGSCVAFSSFAWLVQNAKPDLVATYAYVNPVVAVFLGALVLSEPLDAWIMSGAALIVGSVVLVVRGGRRSATV